MSELEELASKVEALQGPSREVDADIALTHGWTEHPGDNWMGPHAEIAVPSYTASLDAAMTLLDGVCVLITLSEIKGDGMPLCVVGNPETSELFQAVADTPALALCAAALRARSMLKAALPAQGDE